MRAGVRRGRCQIGLAGAVLLATVGAGLRVARAEAKVPLDLEWDAPAGCPDVAYVNAAIAHLLEESPLESSRVRARGVVTHREGEGFSLTLTTTKDGAVGKRSLEADSCAAVADATALIVALTIDPVHVVPAPVTPAPAASSPLAAPSASAPPTPSASASAPPVAAAPAPRASSVPATPAPPPAPSSTPASRAVRFAVAASFMGDLGSLPSPGFGVQGAVALSVARFRIEAFGSYLPAQSEPTAVLGSTVAVSLANGGALGCFAVVSSLRWELDPCAGVEVGAVRGTATISDALPAQTFLWAAARLEARLTFRVTPRLHLTAGVGAAAPFQRNTFTVDDAPGSAGATTVFKPSAVSGRAFVGPEVMF